MYNDPLHIPRANYSLWHKGEPVLTLNKMLLDSQNVWTHVTKILELHSERLHLEDMMNGAIEEFNYHRETSSRRVDLEDFLMLCNEYYNLIEFELQEAWGFPLDGKFHRFWVRPGCSCPVMDNDDRYPNGYYITQADCLIHGYDVKKNIEDAKAELKAMVLKENGFQNKLKKFLAEFFS